MVTPSQSVSPLHRSLPRVARKLLVFNVALTVVLLLIIAMWLFFIVGQVRSLGTEDADVLGEQTFEEANFFDVESEDAFGASVGMFPAILVSAVGCSVPRPYSY